MLILSDRSASTVLHAHLQTSSVYETSLAPFSALLVSMLLPEAPGWQDKLIANPIPQTLRCNTLALRLHPNSSALWRFRTSLIGSDHSRLAEEVQFLFSVSGFKKFNYHIFNYWISLVTVDNLIPIHLPVLSKFMRANPSNYSPFHIIVETLRESTNPAPLLNGVLSRLELPDFVKATDAHHEFMESCRLLFAERGIDWTLQPS